MEKKWCYLSYRTQLFFTGIFVFWLVCIVSVWIFVIKVKRFVVPVSIVTTMFAVFLCVFFFVVYIP